MAVNQRLPIADAVLDFLVSKATPEEILAFRMPEADQERAAELFLRNNSGTLTEAERMELDEIIQTERFMTRLKTKALIALHEK